MDTVIMTLHSWARSESKALDFDLAQPRRFGHVFSEEIVSLKSLKTIKHMLNYGTEKTPQNLCLWLWWTAAKEITPSMKKRTSQEVISILPNVWEKTTGRRFLKKQAQISTSCLILCFCQSNSCVLLISGQKTIKKQWLLQRRSLLSFGSSWS